SAGMKPTVSVTHCVGAGGIGVSAAKTAAETTRTTPIARRTLRINLELHFRRFLGSGSCLEVWFDLEFAAKKTCDDHRWETITGRIEVLRRQIKPHAFLRNAIFCAFQL